MITKVLFSGTPLNRAIFEDKLYPMIDIDLSSVQRKMLIPLKDIMDSNIIGNTWITLEKKFKPKTST